MLRSSATGAFLGGVYQAFVDNLSAVDCMFIILNQATCISSSLVVASMAKSKMWIFHERGEIRP
jgi:hypothetical protein